MKGRDVPPLKRAMGKARRHGCQRKQRLPAGTRPAPCRLVVEEEEQIARHPNDYKTSPCLWLLPDLE